MAKCKHMKVYNNWKKYKPHFSVIEENHSRYFCESLQCFDGGTPKKVNIYLVHNQQ